MGKGSFRDLVTKTFGEFRISVKILWSSFYEDEEGRGGRSPYGKIVGAPLQVGTLETSSSRGKV